MNIQKLIIRKPTKVYSLENWNRINQLETYKPKYKKIIVGLCGLIVVISIITPFTNMFLIPLSYKLFKRFA